MAVPPRARGPVAPRPGSGRPMPGRGPGRPLGPPGGRPPAASGRRPGAQPYGRTRAPSHGPLPQRLLIGLLLVATLGAGVWWVAFRGSAPDPGNFVRQQQRFAEAARAVPESAGRVTDVTTLRSWNKDVETHLAEMDRAYAAMTAIQGRSKDEAAVVVTEALIAAGEIIELTGDYRDEFNNGELGTAESAADAVEALLERLEAKARAWKRL